MSNDEPRVLMAGQMTEYESRNYRGRHRRLKAGSIWLAEQEIERETWDLLETIPAGAIIHHVIWWSDGDATGSEKAEPEPVQCERHATWNRGPCPECTRAEPEPVGHGEDPFSFLHKDPEPKVKPEKGPWSAFWRECFAHGIQNVPALHKELGCNGMGQSVKLALRARFKEDSLTKVSPDRFQAWAATKRLQEVLVLTEQALSKIGGIEYKWGKNKQEGAAA